MSWLGQNVDLGWSATLIRLATGAFFVHVIAQPRGSGKSEGTFGDEEWDHYDTIERITQQSWSDGKVGMVGILSPIRLPNPGLLIKTFGCDGTINSWYSRNDPADGTQRVHHRLGAPWRSLAG
jgi:hypothetical protein